jgi:hypothetical protein
MVIRPTGNSSGNHLVMKFLFMFWLHGWDEYPMTRKTLLRTSVFYYPGSSIKSTIIGHGDHFLSDDCAWVFHFGAKFPMTNRTWLSLLEHNEFQYPQQSWIVKDECELRWIGEPFSFLDYGEFVQWFITFAKDVSHKYSAFKPISLTKLVING